MKPFSQESLQDGDDTLIAINPYTGESNIARTGTVTATLNNVARLNELMEKEETLESKQEVLNLLATIERLVPSLQVLGMFDLFTPSQWIGEGEQMGRIAVIYHYFKHNLEKYTPELKIQLESVKNKISSLHLRELLNSI